MKKVLGSIVSMMLIVMLGFVTVSPAEEIVLKQWYHQYGEEGTQQAAMRYAEEYNKLMASQGKNVKVEVNWVPGDYQAKLAAALLTDEAPDVFEGFPNPSLVKAGHLAELGDLYTPEILADFNPAGLATATVNGKIYGVKMIIDTVGIYYRKSQLEDAGLKPPTNMDELIAAAKKLTTKRVKGLFLGNDGGMNGFIGGRFMIWSAGNWDIQNMKVAFDNERTDAAIKKFGELYNSGALLMGAPTDWWDPSAFLDGLAAMQFCGLWAAPALMEALGDDLGVIPFPPLDDKGVPVGNIGGWIEMVNAKGKHVEEAKAFVKWLWIENAKNQEDWCLGYGFHIPARKSLAAKAEKLQAAVPKVFVENTSNYGRPEGPYWTGAMGTILGTAVTNIVKNGADARAEVKAAAEQCQAELDASLQ